MDYYEAVGELYERRQAKAESAHGALECEAYVYMPEPEGEKVRGRWHDNGELVWYACYGSNMDDERFDCYIKGGCYCGRVYDGCSDKSAWLDSYTTVVDGNLYFAFASRRWEDCGVAFYDKRGAGRTFMRMYMVKASQLDGIHEQEGKSVYGSLEYLGRAHDGRRVYTITSSYVRDDKNAPSEAYRQLLESALVKNFGLSRQQAVDYLAAHIE